MHKFPIKRCQHELVEWLEKQGYTYHVTLNFNDRGMRALPELERKVQEFHKRLNRWLLGKCWHLQFGRHCEMIAFPEHLDSNTHFHCLLKLEGGRKIDTLEREMQAIWKNLVLGGQCYVQPYNGRDKKLLYYVTKETMRPEYWGLWLLLPKYK